MKLELKHLAPYLPYGLKGYAGIEIYLNNGSYIDSGLYSLHIGNVSDMIDQSLLSQCKPILRPLSDLLKDIETTEFGSVNGVEFICTTNKMKDDIRNAVIKDTLTPVHEFKYWQMERLFKYHFDVFGLIEKGLAININTL